MNIPHHEIQAFLAEVSRFPAFRAKKEVANYYRALGHDVIEDPFSPDIATLILSALKTCRPFSAVRVGDGEANILAFSGKSETPILDRKAARQIIAKQDDSFKASRNDLLFLKHLLVESIALSDVVGVRGFWNYSIVDTDRSDRKGWSQLIRDDPRGISGWLRSESYMLSLAEKGTLKGKLIVSAHFYLGVLENLDCLFDAAPKVLPLTNRLALANALRMSYPGKDIILVPVGCCDRQNLQRTAKRPNFLWKVECDPGPIRKVVRSGC